MTLKQHRILKCVFALTAVAYLAVIVFLKHRGMYELIPMCVFVASLSVYAVLHKPQNVRGED